MQNEQHFQLGKHFLDGQMFFCPFVAGQLESFEYFLYGFGTPSCAECAYFKFSDSPVEFFSLFF